MTRPGHTDSARKTDISWVFPAFYIIFSFTENFLIGSIIENLIDIFLKRGGSLYSDSISGGFV